MKYDVPKSEGNFLPNKLGVEDPALIARLETTGFALAEERLIQEIEERRFPFDVNFILYIHRLALGELYEFAGQLRRVNVSKGGFFFPAAIFLEKNMREFEERFLRPLPQEYVSDEDLIRDIARVHAELLFIHPFREGNGRTARLLANLMAIKEGKPSFNFERLISPNGYDSRYIAAVQAAAQMDYQPMNLLIAEIAGF